MKKHLFGLTCAAILSACGGDGGSTDNSNPNNGTDPLDRYIGTWNRPCDTWSMDDISDTNGKGISVIESIKIEKTSSVKASYVYTVKVFANADTQCAAQPIATIVKTGLNNANSDTSNAIMTMLVSPNKTPNTLTHPSSTRTSICASLPHDVAFNTTQHASDLTS